MTYPEFLLHSSQRRTRPEPLVTASRLTTALYTLSALSTLAYGGARFVARPMADALAAAQSEFWDGAKQDVDRLVERLEGAVSEIPAELRGDGGTVHEKRRDEDEGKHAVDDERDAESNASSSYEDPTELFHRDFGTQTSTPTARLSPQASPAVPAYASSLDQEAEEENREDQSEAQARRISALAASLRALATDIRGETESSGATKTEVDGVRDDVAALKYRVFRGTTTATTNGSTASGGYSLPGSGIYNSRNTNTGATADDAADEVDRLRDAIRRVKGALLASRNFPAAVSGVAPVSGAA